MVSLFIQATSLLDQGLAPQVVAQRLGVTQDWVRTVARVTGRIPNKGAPPEVTAVAGIGTPGHAAVPTSQGGNQTDCLACSLKSLCTAQAPSNHPERCDLGA